MYTSAVLVALTSFLAHEEMALARHGWLNDYSAACQRGRALHKPLAVFIGSGDVGWEKITKEDSSGNDVKEILASHYVCVYLDTTKDEGRQLARAFAVYAGQGMVLSDSSGKLQAFHHDGDLDSSELDKYLRRYADPDRVALTTETREDLQPRSAPMARPASRYTHVSRSC
jgi:hypothetical protein